MADRGVTIYTQQTFVGLQDVPTCLDNVFNTLSAQQFFVLTKMNQNWIDKITSNISFRSYFLKGIVLAHVQRFFGKNNCDAFWENEGKIHEGGCVKESFFENFQVGIVPAGTRRRGDVPWRSPKGPNVRDLQGTFRGLLRDKQKNWWFDEKSVF